MLTIKRSSTRPLRSPRWGRAVLILLIAAGACRAQGGQVIPSEPTTLTIGFGLVSGTTPDIGIRQVARNIAVEQLTSVPPDGRTLARLAESWSVSGDGLLWRVHLRPATFHSGRPADAASIVRVLNRELQAAMGPAFEDVMAIRATSNVDLEFTLRHRSTFLLEALGDAAIQETAPAMSGTGPFYVTNGGGSEIEMRANERYYGSRPAIDRIVIKPYTSVRSAWADLLRGRVDVLYDVGVDALDSLEASKEVNVFTFQRGYAYVLLLNVKKPPLNDPAFRRALNSAIDREALVSQVLAGHGAPADGPVWRHHWAYSPDFPRFAYQPQPLTSAAHRRRFTCLVLDRSHERLALATQRQLQAIGVNVDLEFVSAEQGVARLQKGDFEAVLVDYRGGPNMVRPYLFWDTAGPNNWGHYSNKAVDAALAAIRLAPDDDQYRSGVEAFQRAIVDDPPAVFLTWRERARAVGRRFVVSAAPGVDILTTVNTWTPAAGVPGLSAN